MGPVAGDLKRRLDHDSHVVVDQIFQPDLDFSPLYDEWQLVLDGVIETFLAEGLLTSPFEGLSFEQRLVAVTSESRHDVSRYFDICLPQRDIRIDTPVCASPAIFHLLTHDKLLDVVEALIGPEITSNPTQHVRMKLPHQACPTAGTGSPPASRSTKIRCLVAGSRQVGRPDLLGGDKRCRRVERLCSGLPREQPKRGSSNTAPVSRTQCKAKSGYQLGCCLPQLPGRYRCVRGARSSST